LVSNYRSDKESGNNEEYVDTYEAAAEVIWEKMKKHDEENRNTSESVDISSVTVMMRCRECQIWVFLSLMCEYY